MKSTRERFIIPKLILELIILEVFRRLRFTFDYGAVCDVGPVPV